MTVKVMLIDDHPVVRAGLRAILDGFDDVCVVAEGADGADATRAQEVGADVLVMDIQMPGTDGIAATRTNTSAGGPPVLMLTTYDTGNHIMDALEAGATGYLLKDAPEDTLHRAVLDTAAGRRTLSSDIAARLAEQIGRAGRTGREALSSRETEILEALATGASNRELARRFVISLATVKTHLIHIYQKLGVENRTAAVAEARSRRLIEG
ncbi:response regulator transcription factor [Corynebacterium sp.]|uniref:response regulator transcription factor n=1 Tax=Corynebacterium sp. TaxID=1720 RepID=UPI0028B1EC9B|nr:response regulator transcription factor [Corynebacterium sp.]